MGLDNFDFEIPVLVDQKFETKRDIVQYEDDMPALPGQDTRVSTFRVAQLLREALFTFVGKSKTDVPSVS